MQPQNPADSVEKRPLAPVYQLDDLVVDTGRMSVTRNGLELPLPKLSFDLLVALIKAAPSVVSQDELMDGVWPGLVVGPETVSQRIKLLRDSLGDDPKMPRYVAGVRGRGYRLLPDVVRRDPAGEATAAASAAAVESGPRWQLILSLLTLGIVVAAAFWLFLDRGRNGSPAEETLSDAPYPREASPCWHSKTAVAHRATDILAEGIPETVLHQLAQFPGLTVIARGSSFAFREHPQDLRVIGRRLDVRYLLEGSVQNAGEHLRVTSSLVDAQSGASVWSMQFDRAPSDVFAVQDEIAIEVVRAMQVTLDAGTDSVASLRHGVTRVTTRISPSCAAGHSWPTCVSPTCRRPSSRSPPRSARILISPLPTCCSRGHVSHLRSRDPPSIRRRISSGPSKAPSVCSTRRSRSIRRAAKRMSSADTSRSFPGSIPASPPPMPI